jgi:hypothetical protein
MKCISGQNNESSGTTKIRTFRSAEQLQIFKDRFCNMKLCHSLEFMNLLHSLTDEHDIPDTAPLLILR